MLGRAEAAFGCVPSFSLGSGSVIKMQKAAVGVLIECLVLEAFILHLPILLLMSY